MSNQDDNLQNASPPPVPSAIPERREDDEFYRRSTTPQANTQQPGQKGCSKGCMWGLAGCGCLTLLVAVGVIAGAMWLANFATKAYSDDPVKVKATAESIADLTPPEGFEPKARFDIFLGKMVVYITKDQGSMLMVMEIEKAWLGNDPQQQKQIEQQLKQGLQNQQNQGGNKDLQIVKSETKELKIRGETSKVIFAEGKDSSGKEFEQISGTFSGKGGPATFIMHIPKEKYKEEEVVKFLEGIK